MKLAVVVVGDSARVVDAETGEEVEMVASIAYRVRAGEQAEAVMRWFPAPPPPTTSPADDDGDDDGPKRKRLL